MRVISGSAKGLKLLSLEGDNTRPTTDKVKEAIFSMIQFDVYGSNVLDLFAGSGAMGIEALSRGALRCDFVEQNKSAALIVKKNIEKARVAENSFLHNITAQNFLAQCNKKYDIVFLDPPYHKGLCEWAVKEICKNGFINDDGLFVCETSADEQLPFDSIKAKRYGTIAVTVIKKEDVV